MKKIATLVLLAAFGYSASAQIDTITNASFERWGNASPGVSTEPTSWYSDQSGSNTAMLGPETCFRDDTAYAGSYSVKLVTQSLNLIIETEYINGVVTTGVVNAPTTSKADGYIGTENFSDSTTDIRRMNFTGRPDSLVGWYQYTQSTSTSGTGGSSEQGKVRAILHVGQYYDPETPTTYHGSCTANEIGDALFLTPMSNTTSWTRFSVPFTYVSSATPAYIMINVTSSANQVTSVAGSTLLLDDLNVIYNDTISTSVKAVINEEDVNVYSYEKTAFVQFLNGKSANQSVITLIDISGKKVFSAAITNNGLNSYNLSDLIPGVYFYQVSNGSYNKTGKISIQ